MTAIYASLGPHGFWVFLLVTVLMGGAAALATGRAIAQTWRPFWQLVFYTLLLALTVRFLHYSLFGQPLLAPGNLLLDWLVLAGAGAYGYHRSRRRQMVEQYGWLKAKH
jgi:hypothetical protein